MQVIGANVKEFVDLEDILREEAADIHQDGDVNVVDVPIVAEICRAIHTNKNESMSVEKKNASLFLFKKAVKSALASD